MYRLALNARRRNKTAEVGPATAPPVSSRCCTKFRTPPGIFPRARLNLNLSFCRTCIHADRDMIPDADIWRAATLMLKRYGENAQSESARRADELAAEGDREGAAVWRLITDAIAQLANTTPSGPVH